MRKLFRYERKEKHITVYQILAQSLNIDIKKRRREI